MRSCLKHLFLLSLISACTGSSGGGGDGGGSPQDPKTDGRAQNSEIPAGETEVFKFDSSRSFAKAAIDCKQSGYGYALDDKLNKMAVCCISLSADSISQNFAKFVVKSEDRVTIKPEKCDAAVIRGDTGDLALPLDIDASGLRFLSLKSNMYNVKKQLTVTGSEALETKLVGSISQTFYGKTKISNIHSVGTVISYKIRDVSDFNELNLSNVKIDSDDVIKSQLILSVGTATSIGTAGAKMNFSKVQITADQANPVLLDGFPFDTTGIEILAGKKFAPHIGLHGKYLDTTGILAETRYPIIPTIELIANSHLRVGPGVMLKLPEEADKYGFFGSGYQLSLEGTSDKRVTVTGSRDDSVGGDSNGDGNLSAPQTVSLAAGWSSATVDRCKGVSVHFADLKGVGIFAGRSTPISLGNVTFKPSDSGADWYNSIRLLRASDAEEYPTLTFDGPVEAWHKNEIYNDSGKTRAKAMIFAAHWSSWATQGGRVKGLNLLTVHNTSTSAQKIDADIRVMGENKGSCNKIENEGGQITAEMKASVYYIDDSNTNFKICE